MKINSIQLNCRLVDLVRTARNGDSVLILFRTPVALDNNGINVNIPGSSVIVYPGGMSGKFYRSGTQELHFDYISFRMNSSEKQYLMSFDFPMDKPIRLRDDMMLLSLIRGMDAMSLKKGKNYNEFMELSMRLIFIVINDAHIGADEEKIEEIPHYQEFKALRDSIYDDPMNKWTVDEMCGDLEMSRTYFHRLYFKAFGVTCRQDIIKSRLLYAADLLKNTNMSVSEISESCGYDSDSYFMRQFKQHNGCTPTEFRRRAASEK